MDTLAVSVSSDPRTLLCVRESAEQHPLEATKTFMIEPFLRKLTSLKFVSSLDDFSFELTDEVSAVSRPSGSNAK